MPEFEAKRYEGRVKTGGYLAGYEYGCRMANDSRYRGRTFSEVEFDLRRDYEAQHPEGTWERMKESIRYGWDRPTQKASGAGR